MRGGDDEFEKVAAVERAKVERISLAWARRHS